MPSNSEAVGNERLYNVVDAAGDDIVNSASEAAVSNISSSGLSVAVGLSSGQFDASNVKLLRTCSEPDLSQLTRHADNSTHKSLEGRLSDSQSPASQHDDLSAGVSWFSVVNNKYISQATNVDGKPC